MEEEQTPPSLDKPAGSPASPAASWRDIISVHPAADRFPLLKDTDPQALQEIADDIGANELQQDIVIWYDEAGKEWLLDGRNRLDALHMLGCRFSRFNNQFKVWTPPTVAPVFVTTHKGEDPVAFVISQNLKRRHLTVEDRKSIALELLRANPDRSNRSIAAEVSLDKKTVDAVRKDGERRGDIPHTETRTDATGRRQQAHKPKPTAPKPAATPEPTPAAATKPGNGFWVPRADDRIAASPTAPVEPDLRTTIVDIETAKTAIEQWWATADEGQRTDLYEWFDGLVSGKPEPAPEPEPAPAPEQPASRTEEFLKEHGRHDTRRTPAAKATPPQLDQTQMLGRDLMFAAAEAMRKSKATEPTLEPVTAATTEQPPTAKPEPLQIDVTLLDQAPAPAEKPEGDDAALERIRSHGKPWIGPTACEQLGIDEATIERLLAAGKLVQHPKYATSVGLPETTP